MMHEEVSSDVIKVRMEFGISFYDIGNIFEGFIVFVLLLQDTNHQKMFVDELLVSFLRVEEDFEMV
jgi:hypothetical protein